MFKSGRWSSDKSKIKIVLRLQFQATQVPQLKKGKGLMISLIPADAGKPSLRLEKAAVLEGICSWEKPIYVTVKLVREPKTGRFQEKLYYFNVTAGSSRKGFLGEVGVDFADFSEATESVKVSLPLEENSDSGPILHVTIQKIQGTDNPRQAEENGFPRDESTERSLEYQMSNCERDGNNLEFTNDTQQYGSFQDFQIDDTALRHRSETQERNSMLRNKTLDGFPNEKHVYRISSTDWSVGSASDRSAFDLTNSPDKNFPIDSLPETSNSLVEILRNENRKLERQAEVTELELQSLRKQILKESRRGQDISIEITSLKEEKDKLGVECERLKSSQKACIELADEETQKLNVLVLELRRELKHENNLNKTLCLQLQKTEDSNSELILAVKDLDRMLEQKDAEIFQLSNKVKASENIKEVKAETCKRKMDQEEEEQGLRKQQKEQESAKEADLLQQKIRDLNAEITVNCRKNNELMINKEQIYQENELLKQENIDISSKLEQSQIEQMKLQNKYSESLTTIKEFQLHVERLEEKITTQAQEISQSLDTISELEHQIKSLEKELEKQGQCFEDDLEALTNAKAQQETRAIRAEEALRKTRLSNANAAEHLQEEFRRVSLEMTSKVDENEKLAMEAAAEAQDHRLQIRALKEMLKKAGEELLLTKDQHEQELQKLLKHANLQAEQIEQMTRNLDEKQAQLNEYENGNNKAFLIKNQTVEAATNTQVVEDDDYPAKEELNKKGREDIKQIKTSANRSHQWVNQTKELERELASVRKEAEKMCAESVTWKTLNDEKDAIVFTLQSEMERIRENYDELKHCLESKTANVDGSQQKKEEAISGIDNKPALFYSFNAVSLPKNVNFIKESTVVPEVMNASITERTLKQSRSVMVTREREIFSEEEQITPTSHCIDDLDLMKLLSEVESLNERNKRMEGELREMQEKYSEISLKFAEVEGERQQLVMTVRNLKNGKKK